MYACISYNYATHASLAILRKDYKKNKKIQKLERVHGYKYLGVWISDDLTWTEHIDSMYM